MWNKPTVKQLSKIPKFYSTEKVPLKEKMIYMHFTPTKAKDIENIRKAQGW